MTSGTSFWLLLFCTTFCSGSRPGVSGRHTSEQNAIQYKSFVHHIEDSLRQLLSENHKADMFFAELTRKPNSVLEIKLVGDIYEASDEGYVSDSESASAPDAVTSFFVLTEDHKSDPPDRVPQARTQPGKLYPDLPTCDISGFSSGNFPCDSQGEPPKALVIPAALGPGGPAKTEPEVPGPSPLVAPKSSYIYAEPEMYPDELPRSVVLGPTSEPGDHQYDYPKYSRFSATLATERASSTSSAHALESLAAAMEELYEEISDIDLDVFTEDEKKPAMGSPQATHYNPMDSLGAALMLTDVGKWRSFVHALKAVVRSGTRLFTSCHDSESCKDEPVSGPGRGTEASKHYLVGHAAWTRTDDDEDQAGFSGGLDDKFITTAESGSAIAFGVADGSQSAEIGPLSMGISERMCLAAQQLFERSPELDPLLVMKASYQEAVLDTTVAAGSAGTIFGAVRHKTLRFAHAGTPWLSVFRGGSFVLGTERTMQSAEEIYPFAKVPSVAKAHSPDMEARDVFASIELNAWQLEKGDVVLAATNGLYKRLNTAQMERSLDISLKRGWDMMQAAAALVETAIGVLQVDLGDVPFWVHAPEKSEDIMVVMIEIL